MARTKRLVAESIIRRRRRTSSFSMSEGRVMRAGFDGRTGVADAAGRHRRGASRSSSCCSSRPRCRWKRSLTSVRSVLPLAPRESPPPDRRVRVVHRPSTRVRPIARSSSFGAFVGWICPVVLLERGPGRDLSCARRRACSCCSRLVDLAGGTIVARVCALMKAYIAGATIACADAFITRRPVHNGVVPILGRRPE